MLARTHQQAAILQVLQDLERPVTPQELLEIASTKSPGLGLATVYRALKRLVESGEVQRIDVAKLPPHYEPSGKSHHHFFVCEVCEKMFDLLGCTGGFQEMLPPGFRMNSHEVVIYGECGQCAT